MECKSLLGGGAGTNSTNSTPAANSSNTSDASAAAARRVPRRSLRRALLQALPLPTDVSLDSAARRALLQALPLPTDVSLDSVVGGVFLGVDSWQVLTASHSSSSHLNLCRFCH